MELARANDDKPKAKRRRETGFEEYGGYMGAKERKLALQNEQRHINFNKEVSSISCDSTISKSNANIFIGTKIHINGYTKPSSDALRDMIVSRGGQMVHFFQKTKVTHMLAMNLPQSKINSLLKVNTAQGGQSGHSSQPVKVVHPNWILDCVAAGRLLSSTPYLLFTEEGQKRSEVQRRVKSPSHSPSAIPKQPAISSEESTIEQMIVGESETRPISDNTGDALFESSGILFEETSSNEKTTEIPRNQQLNASQEGEGRRKDEVGILASANVDFPSDNLSLLITESLFEESQKQQETDEPPAENISNLIEFESGTSNRKKCENSAALDRVHQWKLTSNPNYESSTCMQTNRLTVASSSKFDSSSRIAKAGDKDFLKEFYGNSRLHHISMWGSQFKQLVKQFQTKPPKDAINWDTFEPQDADFNLSSINHRCKPCCWEPALNDHSNEVKVILHVDMDCFFVSVGLLKHPELRGQPVAVTHSKGSGPVVSDEVSGGTKATMSFRTAFFPLSSVDGYKLN